MCRPADFPPYEKAVAYTTLTHDDWVMAERLAPLDAPRAPQTAADGRSAPGRRMGWAGRVLARRDRLVRLRRWREGDSWCGLLRSSDFHRTVVWVVVGYAERDRLAGGREPDAGATDAERDRGCPVGWYGARL